MPEDRPGTTRPVPEEGFEDLYENAPCGYASIFVDGLIFRANATLAAWTGQEPHSLVGKHFRDLLSMPSRIVYETQLQPLVQTAAPFEEVLLDLQLAPGETLPVLINGVARHDAATGVHYRRLTLVRAPERRRYERSIVAEAVQSRQRLADATETAALREQFIAVLGHDLRNPLASISAASRLLSRQPQNEASLNVLRLMDDSVRRMAALIDNVLDFARGRLGGGLAVDRKPTLLEPVIRHLVAELQTAFPERVFETTFDLAEPANVDAGRIGQLMSNLLGNAITHGDPAAPIKVGGTSQGGALEVWVANAGEPISGRAKEHLFQPFFRGEVRASQQGLGLGLYIASEIAAAHGGAVSVVSGPEETRFTLRIPAE